MAKNAEIRAKRKKRFLRKFKRKYKKFQKKEKKVNFPREKSQNL